jgi:prophage DNA circulation protein
MSALLRRYALAQLAVTLTTYQPFSQQDADSVLSSATSLFDNEITIAGDAGDDESYLALRTLRQSVIADMTARGANLATVETFTFQASLPSLVLAQRIYRDPTREPGLVQQVDPIHPAFMPTSFSALSA